jgi:hypothetical protein
VGWWKGDNVHLKEEVWIHGNLEDGKDGKVGSLKAGKVERRRGG